MKKETKNLLEQINNVVSVSNNMTDAEKAWIKKLIRQVMYVESNDAKVGKFDLYKFVAPDMLRPQLTGIYFDPEGYRVACDTKTLVAVKSDIDEDKSGKIIAKNGEVIEARYPNWRYVIPDDKYLYKVRIDINEALNACKQLECNYSLEKGKEDVSKYCVRIDNISFAYKRFKAFLSIMKEFGTDVISISDCGARAGKIEQDGNIAMIMPVLIYAEDAAECISLTKVERI